METVVPSSAQTGAPLVLGNCRLIDKLGQGGMGAVYRAQHQTLGRVVALKILPAEFTQNPEYVQRFLREARAAAQLKHPNIVQVYDAGEQQGQYYICMEFVDGSSLASFLKQRGFLGEGDGLRLMAQAVQGLAAAHAQGLVHRDIKPENLLLGKDGVLKIADFGLVSNLHGDSALTQAGAMLGTPTYMSPEQCEGQTADARSDLYSLGATFFRLLTGSAPFSAPTPIGILYKHKFEATPDPRAINPALSEQVARLLLKLMAKQPAERFQSALELSAQLNALGYAEEPTRSPSALAALAPGSSPAVSASAAAHPSGAALPSGVPAGTYTPIHLSTSPTPAETPTLRPAGPAHTPPPATTFMGQPALPLRAPRRDVRLALAALGLLLAAGGGWFGYGKYHQDRIASAKALAQDQRLLKQHALAIQTLEAAHALYPEESDLKCRRDAVEVEWIQERVAKLKERASASLELANPKDAVEACVDALTLEAKGASLAGFDKDLRLPVLKKKAADLRDFQQFMTEGQAAEKAGRHDAAVRAYDQAQAFEAKPGREAAVASTRAAFQGLLTAAERLEKEGHPGTALERVNQAAALKVEDLSKLQERLLQKIQFEKLVAEAGAETQAGKLRTAAAKLEQAAALCPENSAGEQLRAQAQDLVRDADYQDALAKGDAAMAGKRWGEAQAAYRIALGLKPKETLPAQKLEAAALNELVEQADAAVQAQDWSKALAAYRKASERAPNDEELKKKAAGLQAQLARIAACDQEARAAEAAGGWELALAKWNELAVLDPLSKSTCETRAANARYEAGMSKARASLQAGRFEEALVQAQATLPYDSSGGARAQAVLTEIKNKIAARDTSAAQVRAVEQTAAFVREGKLGAALALLGAASKNDPTNAELANQKASLEAVEALEKSYTRLQQLREDAQAAIQTALDADKDDKKVKALLDAVKAWEVRLANARREPRAAWLERQFDKLPPALSALQGDARELAQMFNGQVAEFRGKAASAAKPKANIGGMLGGFGGGRVGGFGAVGARADVGDNQKHAAIYDATAQTLARCAEEARRLGASE